MRWAERLLCDCSRRRPGELCTAKPDSITDSGTGNTLTNNFTHCQTNGSANRLANVGSADTAANSALHHWIQLRWRDKVYSPERCVRWAAGLFYLRGGRRRDIVRGAGTDSIPNINTFDDIADSKPDVWADRVYVP